MTQQEGNKLIAEFMGAEVTQPYSVVEEDNQDGLHFTYPMHYKHEIGNSRHHSSSGLKYHSSWDWLMPVVEKIEGLGFDTAVCGISVGEENIIECLISPVIKNNNIEVHIKQSGEKIKILWQSIILFIQWYNIQKQNP